MNHQTLTNEEINTYLAEKILRWTLDEQKVWRNEKSHLMFISSHSAVLSADPQWNPTQDANHLEQVLQEVVKDDELSYRFIHEFITDSSCTHERMMRTYFNSTTEKKARAIVAAHLSLTQY